MGFLTNQFRTGLVYDLHGQIVGYNIDENTFVEFTELDVEMALYARALEIKRENELDDLANRIDICVNGRKKV